MINKLKTLIWFFRRFTYWRYALSLIARKLYKNKDSVNLRAQATEWAANQSVSMIEALKSIDLLSQDNKIDLKLSPSLIEHAKLLAQNSKVEMGGAGGIRIDHTHRIRDVIRDPDFLAVRPNREPHRVDADVDTRDDGITGRVDDIDGVGWRVHHEDVAAAHHNRRRVRTHERGMSDIVEGNLLGVRDGESREAHAGDQNPGPQPAQCVRHQFRSLLHVGCRRR